MLKKILNAWRAQPALPDFVPPSETNPLVVKGLQSKSTQYAQVQKQPHRGQVRFFTAAGHARNQASWISQDTAINAILQSQLYTMRTRSRHLTRNTSPGRRFTTLVKNNVIGPDGIRLQSRCGDMRTVQGEFKWVLDNLANDAIESHYKIWSQAKHCDVTGEQSLPEMCRMLAHLLAQDGEILVKEVVGTKATPYRYQLQVLAIDRLDINYNGKAANGNQVRMGVEFDSTGKKTAYYVLLRNPNDSLSLGMQKHERIAANEIIHRFVKTDPEQLRGFPWTHAVMNGERMLQMFQDAALEASVVGASNMGFYKPPAAGAAGYIVPGEDGIGAEVADAQEAGGALVKDAVGGAFEVLPEGWDFTKFDPNYPHAAYKPFVDAIKLDLAAGLDIANHNLSGDMTGVNYSSARIAELQERDVWRGLQKFFINAFFKHVTERWLELGLLAGAITMENGSPLPATKLDKFLAGLNYVPRGWDWVDPKNEIAAAAEAIDQALTTRSKVVASKGGDFEENIIELAREMEILQTHGVTLGQMNKPTQAAPAPDNTQGDTQNA